MSRIHDALRRGFRSAQPRQSSRASRHADTVLATLGYKKGAPRGRTRQLISVLLVVGVAAAALYVSWPSASPRHPSRLQNVSSALQTKAPRSPLPSYLPDIVAARQAAAPPAALVADRPAAPSTKRAVTTGSRNVAVGGIAASASGSGTTPAAPRDDFQLALYYQRAGEFDRSLVHYQAVLQRDELNVEAHNNLGLLYKDKGLTEEAIREFQRALSIAPRYGRAHNNLGVTLLELGRFDAAAAEFRAALAIDPRDVDAMINLALAQKSTGQVADARGGLVRALAVDPHNAPAHYNLGLQYEAAGEAARALEHYKAFLAYSGPEYAARAPDVRARITALETRLR